MRPIHTLASFTANALLFIALLRLASRPVAGGLPPAGRILISLHALLLGSSALWLGTMTAYDPQSQLASLPVSDAFVQRFRMTCVLTAAWGLLAAATATALLFRTKSAWLLLAITAFAALALRGVNFWSMVRPDEIVGASPDLIASMEASSPIGELLSHWSGEFLKGLYIGNYALAAYLLFRHAPTTSKVADAR